MIEGIIAISGIIITFFPIFLIISYLLKHSKGTTLFDQHIKLVQDKKGIFGVIIAYLERFLFGCMFISLGVWMSDFFTQEFFLLFFVFSIIGYVIIKYVDEINEK